MFGWAGHEINRTKKKLKRCQILQLDTCMHESVAVDEHNVRLSNNNNRRSFDQQFLNKTLNNNYRVAQAAEFVF